MSISILDEIAESEKKAHHSKEKVEHEALAALKEAQFEAERSVSETKAKLETLHVKKVEDLVKRLDNEKRLLLDKADKDVEALKAKASMNQDTAIAKIIDDFMSRTK
ncbi:hypothetical protein H6504_05435 [Candidatus Woesearchaeota archaeon]|nr:hypothetical protein [Candidatus Woesearchaeota archaeon]